MIFFQKLIGNFRARILTVFSLLLFLAFVSIGLVFNVTVNQYIRSSAYDALLESRTFHEHGIIIRQQGNTVMRFFGGGQHFFYRHVHVFQIGSDYTIRNLIVLEEDILVAETLASQNISLTHINQERLRVDNQIYYISIVPGLDGIYAVFYLDVTDLVHFANGINRMLIVLVGLIWFMSIGITTFLANSLAKPLHILSGFARRIGKGDFSQNTIIFTNEEFEELNQSLNYAAKQLASYDNEQRTFFQNVSHELRTPLMSVKSYAEGIKYEIMPPIEAAETIIDAADKLSNMVDDILYVSRIDSLASPKMTMANLSRIVEDRIKNQKQMADNKNVTIKFETDEKPVMISCVVSYIERAIDNLITNAVRYAESKIVVECYAIGSRAIVRVLDDGPGFEAEALPHVFERFYKGKNGLTGIGLAIVRSIAEQHKGTATAGNSEKKGAILTMSLPRK